MRKEVVQEFMRLLGDQNTDVRRAASMALRQIDIPIDTPLAPLEEALQDTDGDVSSNARVALDLLKTKKKMWNDRQEAR